MIKRMWTQKKIHTDFLFLSVKKNNLKNNLCWVKSSWNVPIPGMKNKKSIYIIVSISLFVGLLHFVTGPGYQGISRNFVRGYLIDILLPMNLYLLLQIALRKHLPVSKSRILASIFVFVFGTLTETLQFYKINFLGSTYDPLDILMYGTGVGLGIAIDYIILEKTEKQSLK